MVTNYLQFLKNYFPHSLGESASLNEIKSLESALNVKFPPEFIVLYQQCNGQKYRADNPAPRLLSLQEISNKINEIKQFLILNYGEKWQEIRLYPNDLIKNQLFNNLWIPFMEEEDGALYCLDFSPASQGNIGQVIFVGVTDDLSQYELIYEAPDFATWINDLLSANDNFTPYIAELSADFFQLQLNLGVPLNSPASNADWHIFQQKFNFQIPEIFQTLYNLFNGYQTVWNNQEFFSLEKIKTVYENWQSALENKFGAEWCNLKLSELENGARMQNCLFHPLWLPFFQAEKRLFCLDFAPAPDGNIAQVISLNFEPYQIEWECENLEQFLESLLEKYESSENL